jgi:hypothetical protein
MSALMDAGGSDGTTPGAERDSLQRNLTSAQQLEHLVKLRQFANELINIAFEGGNADGAHIQELGVNLGLLKAETRSERCGDSCSCAEYGFPAQCFRRTAALSGS